MPTLSRREFLALIGLTAGSGAVACAASSLGLYWLLTDRPKPRSKVVSSISTLDPNRLSILKSIERPPIILREEWGARAVDHDADEEFGFYTLDNPEGWQEYSGDLRDAYQTVIIHHSVEYEVDDLTSIRVVQNLHMEERGWADIGYHFCVGQSGIVFEGRKMNIRGTHTAGFNTGTLGVCLLGNFEEISPTQPQLDSTQALVNWLALRLRLTHLAGHRDFNPQTLCPGGHLYLSLDSFATQAGLLRGTEGYVAPSDQQMTPTPVSSAYGDCCTVFG